MTERSRMSRSEISWILYDVGNSAFVLVMVTALMPIYFKDFAASGLPDATSTSYWGFANSCASLVLAVLSPILGALADYRNRKKILFLIFLSIGLFFNTSLAFTAEGKWLLCLILFIFARIGWAGANIFYDSFLVDVTTRQRMDVISSRGYGFGYIGSVIPFLAIIMLMLSSSHAGQGLPVAQTRTGFLIVAAWWLLMSVPAITCVRQVHYQPIPGSLIKDSFLRLGQTLGNIREYRQVFYFLIAYFFYIDGVGTVISMSTAYGRDLGFGINQLIMVLLFIQVIAFPCALVFGHLAVRFSSKSMIMTGIFIYCIITIAAFSLPAIDNLPIKTTLFWIIAFLVASSMGGIQALSRSYFGKLIPPEKSGEFFGFYNVFGKFAAIGGPFIMGLITSITGESRWGILSLLFLFIAGAWFLSRVEES